jgi:hypothetical protein
MRETGDSYFAGEKENNLKVSTPSAIPAFSTCLFHLVLRVPGDEADGRQVPMEFSGVLGRPSSVSDNSNQDIPFLVRSADNDDGRTYKYSATPASIITLNLTPIRGILSTFSPRFSTFRHHGCWVDHELVLTSESRLMAMPGSAMRSALFTIV